MKVYDQIMQKVAGGQKQLSILIDPDNMPQAQVKNIAEAAADAGIDYFFIGGSLITNDNLDKSIETLKRFSSIPVVIFPGNTMQINSRADALLFLSLISGRNAEMLIGKHVIAAPYIRNAKLEVISTGYMLIESGKPTSVAYMSNSLPIPRDKDDIAVCTAMAGEMLGLKMIYMDAGSGAKETISPAMIEKVKKNIAVPLIAGGGINSAEKAKSVFNSGADMIVVGNAVEKNLTLIRQLADAR
ncbi:MAG TPA: geranylgeranylglyceryl/heptaprenylglyceryl phosphate synthase [Bacteroidales bacterium]|jgi:putative glycerol-1-phosphate prenyltransferase|nr:geranylgeranylglyceryl/heptaprenylglyceryl phosphate synthase [Bacteroidales bacterium]HPB24377.1 geranylgeranylglyceryl/heptaprenylglyceryl phosphate synthase [Bacteroidales bacterium]HPI30945.1 geranylgeranylglyceryl/heptaprenylglyceryl phosphate synthase [Bacteroidales bacterium]HQN15018.1 geranylgeranylglyceryl/heptaprenylglyceryl phosphate synthase [Bacteroidales bacterium]